MNTIDIILLLLILVPGLITGLTKGFIHQVVTLAALWLGALMSAQFATSVGSFIQSLVSLPGNTARILAFILIFILVYIALRLVGAIIMKIAKDIVGGGIDKLLGIVLGILKQALVIGLLVLLFDMVNNTLTLVGKETLDASFMYDSLQEAANAVFPFIKSLIMKGIAG